MNLRTPVFREARDEVGEKGLRSCGLGSYDLASGRCLRTFELP